VPKAKARSGASAEEKKANAVALWEHILAEFTVSGNFPRGLERLREHVDFALLIMLPDSSEADRKVFLLHITPTACMGIAARVGMPGDCRLCGAITASA
jgi:hypothetical protein